MDLKTILNDSSRGMEQVQTFMRLSALAALRLRDATEDDAPVARVMDCLAKNPLAGFHTLVTVASDYWEVSYDPHTESFLLTTTDGGLSLKLGVNTGALT
jgi:hypothetical protein